jgi:hypothetical protein
MGSNNIHNFSACRSERIEPLKKLNQQDIKEAFYCPKSNFSILFMAAPTFIVGAFAWSNYGVN